MSGLTPEVWVYDERYGTIGSVFDSNGEQVCQVTQTVPIVDSSSYDLRRKRARLIAAAPRMYEALNELANNVAWSGVTADCEEFRVRLNGLINNARAVLTEIEGKSNANVKV